MNRDYEKELHRAEQEKARAQKADSFWNAFRLTENGHVKSTLLLNSFCLSILSLPFILPAFYLLTDPIHHLLSAAPRAVENLANALLPAAVGTAACALAQLFCHPRTVLAALPVAAGAGAGQSDCHAADSPGAGRNLSVPEPVYHAGAGAAGSGHRRLPVAAAPEGVTSHSYITEKAVKL